MVLHRHYAVAAQFYFDRRLNVPFFFSLLLSIANLGLLFLIVGYRSLARSENIFWVALCTAFFLFTLDEAFYIHQHFKMSTFGRIASYDRASWSHYLWVIPYIALFGSLMFIMIRHASALEKTIRYELTLAATVFLTGAVGMEAIGTYYAVLHPKGDIYLLLVKSLEGTLQMSGAVMFMNAFLKRIQFHYLSSGH
ncbi:MAG TPA: hypothetical protein VGD40_09475 [Chryseosolibacter sp.]